MARQLHATCIAIGTVGVLLRGPSGSGKSDLALRLIDEGARLVADDRVELAVEDNRLVARSPAAIAGKIEVRGIGIVAVASVGRATVGLVLDLVDGAEIERLPEPAHDTLLGIALPRLRLDPFTASACAKIRLAAAARRVEAAS